MKKVYACIAVTITAAVSLCSIKFINKEKKSQPYIAGEKISEPYEHMLLQRTYPDAHFQFRAFRDAMKEAHRVEELKKLERSSSVLNWTIEGPSNIGGRYNCTAIHPANPNIIYAGAACGGIFKTLNGGTSWTPIFDNQPFLSVGCITFDPKNPNTLWAGTGDPNISGSCYIGDGVYKSTDAGTTWTNMGLNDQYTIASIVIDPANSNIIYVASMGQPFVRDNNRGVYKSTDGGVTWNKMLFVSNEAGIIDLEIDPSNPQVLYAASFNRIRNYAESTAYGVDSKIWKTTDGGTNWTALSSGLPTGAVSRIGICINPKNPNILYASYVNTSYQFNGIYKTTNAGSSWSKLTTTAALNGMCNGYGWYFGKLFINAYNPDQLYVLGLNSYATDDGGNSWRNASSGMHVDHHYVSFFSATSAILSTDGGIYKTTDNGNTWKDFETIPITQLYHAVENPFKPGEFMAGAQDNGVIRGGNGTMAGWQSVQGGDGIQPRYDPVNPNVFYVETQNGAMGYTNNGGASISGFTNGIGSTDRKNWNLPYIISSANHTTMYCGTQFVYKMTGAPTGTWTKISNDLTDGIGTGVDALHTITTLHESPLNASLLYAGTADANVWASINGGSTWKNVTGTLPDRYVTSIVASPNDANTVYVTHSGYRNFEYTPHIHKSIDNGNTWIDITGDLTQFAVNDLLVLPGAETMLYAATDCGVYYTLNGGINWLRLGDNMPIMPVCDIEFNKTGKKIIAATFARSVWSLDFSTVAMQEQMIPGIDLSLFPNPATDVVYVSSNTTMQHGVCTVYDLNGKCVLTKHIESENKQYRIPLTEFMPGIYILKVDVNNQSTTQRFIKM